MFSFNKKRDNLNKNIRKFLDFANSQIDRIMYRYSHLMLKRAIKVHKYNNQTGLLSKSNTSTYNEKKKEIKMINATYYAKYVKAHYDENWLERSGKYYSKSLKRDLSNIVRDYRRKYK